MQCTTAVAERVIADVQITSAVTRGVGTYMQCAGAVANSANMQRTGAVAEWVGAYMQCAGAVASGVGAYVEGATAVAIIAYVIRTATGGITGGAVRKSAIVAARVGGYILTL